jgi:hypothetical protein
VEQVTWYAARASGVVAWALVLLTIVWGMLFATRVLGRRVAPAWLLSLHRYFATLSLVFVGVHVGAIMLDSYTSFGPADVLVPLASSWHPVAVAWGIVGMYLLVAIEVTSLLRQRLSHRVWHAIHLCSYLLFGAITVRFVTAGTDVRAMVASTTGVMIATAAAFGGAALYLWRSDPGGASARQRGAPSSTHHARDRPPTEHPGPEEAGRHDGERGHERVIVHDDPQRHPHGHRHEPRARGAPEPERVTVEARGHPADGQPRGERPGDPHEVGHAGMEMVRPATDDHEGRNDCEVAEERRDDRAGSREGAADGTRAHPCSVAATNRHSGIGR